MKTIRRRRLSNDFSNLPRKDVLPLELRSLYESYGYKKYAMGRFEAYDMYMQNKSFLKGSGIITFTDYRGRLMALKPDVTMSIVKNTAPDAVEQKLFYCENVFRSDSANRECKEISQVGLEYIGADGVYSEAEVIFLALKSLETIDENFVLDISHIGYMVSLLEEIGFSAERVSEVLSEFEKKSINGLTKIAESEGIGEESIKKLCALCEMSGDYESMLKKMRALCDGAEATAACNELEALYGVIKSLGMAKNVRLDFSAAGDTDYYNGLIFKGYVSAVPRAVLAGGRYDSLMKKLGKSQKALGFALYIGELDRMLESAPTSWDYEAMLVYDSAEPKLVAKTVEELRKKYSEVCALREKPRDIRAKNVYFIKNGRVEEA